jgi:hypothetical protein
MKITRIAKIAQVFAAEGLGYITDTETPRQDGNAHQTDSESNPTSPDQRNETSKYRSKVHQFGIEPIECLFHNNIGNATSPN